MPPTPPVRPPPPSSITLNDIYFVLFRHKWMLAAFFAIGLLLAAILYFVTPTRYASEAKLLVRYVTETRSMASPERNPDVKSPDSRGETIINSELEILTSLDLARDVAEKVGPTNLLAKIGGMGDPIGVAASVIASPKNLLVEVPRNSSIIRIRFEHSNPSVVQPVLKQLIESYLQKHLAIHRGVGVMDEFLHQQVIFLQDSLGTNAMDLRQLKTNNGIISVEDSRKAFNDEMLKLQSDVLAAEAELAERQAMLKELPPPKSSAAAAELGVPGDKVDEYRTLVERLNSSRKRESDLSLRWSDQNPLLQGLRSQIAEDEKKRKALEEQFPKLAMLNFPSPSSSSTSTEARGQSLDPVTEFARAKALEVKIKVLTNQYDRVSKDAARIDQAGSEITRLQREREQLESSLRFYVASREQSKMDRGADGLGHITNISIVQSPSAPLIALSKKSKTVLGALVGAILAGLGIAFALELFLDPRVKRPSEIESKLHLPLFLSIPRAFSSTPSNGEAAPSSDLKAYCDAVRDRLTMYFQSRDMTHKPKLVGVTSCAKGAGATTIAAGLAASLSELGGGNVLLVDMAVPNGVTHPFHNGKPACNLLDALETEAKQDALVRTNLFLANASHANDPSLALVPSRFLALMPRFKASDYDYIVFDLPPVSSTSSSAGLAAMLDMTFLVIEAGKTNRETVKRSITLLNTTHATVAAILNKTRNYLPAWLHSEV